MTLLPDPNTVADLYSLYKFYLISINAQSTLAQVKTALIRYTLPGFGLILPDQNKLSYQTVMNGLKFMKQVTIQDFVNALNVQQKVYEDLGNSISDASKRNYRCVLKKMLDWCSTQDWWKSAIVSASGEYAPRIRNGRNCRQIRTSKRKRQEPYTLRVEQVLPNLQKEIDDLYAFLTEPSWSGRQDPPTRKTTVDLKIKHIVAVLGWLHNIKGVSLEKLSLSQIMYQVSLEDKNQAKKCAKKNMVLIMEYLRWLRNERHVHPGTEMQALYAIISIAKYLYYTETDFPDVKSYQDVPIILLLREEIKITEERSEQTPSPIDRSKKWLEWDEFLLCVQRLKAECSERKANKGKRSETAIAQSYQRYLIFAFLAYMPPDRQRTLRELEVGRTLVKTEDNKWYIHLMPEDYKTGASYGEQWSLVPDIFYLELEQWLNKWRLVFNPQHNFVFTRTNGEPFNVSNFGVFFKSVAYRLTGKALTPHLVRDMAITHFQRLGKSDAEMTSLALAMRHSRDMQQRVYDRRTVIEKVTPASNMMLEAAKIYPQKAD